MKNKIQSKQFLFSALLVLAISFFGITAIVLASRDYSQDQTQTVSIQPVQSQIMADGTVGSEQEATLHFQISGKLTYLPFQEGDKVYNGQTIASLDSTTLRAQLAQAINNLKNTQETSDLNTTKQNAGVIEGQQRLSLDQTNKNGYSSIPETDIIYQTVQSIMDLNKTNVDNANLTVAIAQNALELTTLNAPFDGILVREDVTSPQVNITPTTSFVIADPTQLIFKAQVAETDITSVVEGAPVTITLTGINKPLKGIVERIHPENNQNGTYQVDIASSDLAKLAKYGQSGSVLIKHTKKASTVVVPSWVVFENSFVWVETANKIEKRKVTVEKKLGDTVEITSGLSEGDKVITDPKAIVKNRYIIL